MCGVGQRAVQLQQEGVEGDGQSVCGLPVATRVQIRSGSQEEGFANSGHLFPAENGGDPFLRADLVGPPSPSLHTGRQRQTLAEISFRKLGPESVTQTSCQWLRCAQLADIGIGLGDCQGMQGPVEHPERGLDNCFSFCFITSGGAHPLSGRLLVAEGALGKDCRHPADDQLGGRICFPARSASGTLPDLRRPPQALNDENALGADRSRLGSRLAGEVATVRKPQRSRDVELEKSKALLRRRRQGVTYSPASAGVAAPEGWFGTIGFSIRPS